MWLKAPVRLFRRPSVFLGLAAATGVLALSAAAAPLFIESAGAAAVADELSALTPASAGLTVAVTGLPDREAYELAHRRLLDAVRSTRRLSRPILSVEDSGGSEVVAGGRSAAVRPFFRTGATSNIEIVRRVDGRGVLIAEATARALRVEPGDRVRVRFGDLSYPLRVAGMYKTLGLPLDPYWEPLTYQIVSTRPNEPPPPPFLFAPRETIFRIAQEIGTSLTYEWRFDLTGGRVPLGEARALDRWIGALHVRLDDPSSALGAAFEDLQAYYRGVSLSTLFTEVVERVDMAIAAMASSVRLLALAGQAVALLAIAAAAVFVIRRRLSETRLLLAQGVAPAAQGVRLVVESAAAVAIGGAAGWYAAMSLVRTLGPSALLGEEAVGDAFAAAAWSCAFALAAIGLVASAAVRQEATLERGRLRHAVAGLPWEIAVLLLAAASYYEIRTRSSALVTAAGSVPEADLFVLAFPILFIGGMAGVVARLLRRWLPQLRHAGRTSPPPVYLAMRRLADGRSSGMLIVTISAIAIGTFVYASVLVDSTQQTVDAKAHITVGSESSATVTYNTDVPDADFPITRVTRTDVRIGPASTLAHLLSVDRERFASVAYWNDSFGGSLTDLLGHLQRPNRHAVPAILAGDADLPDSTSARTPSFDLPVRIVARVEAFPGMSADRPMLVIDQQVFTARAAGFGTDPSTLVASQHELWAPVDLETFRHALERNDIAARAFESAAEIRRRTDLKTIAWTFELLQALGALAGVLAVVGLLFYLQSRQSARDIAYALARRMGLRSRAHGLALALELGGMLSVASIVGAACAVGAAALMLTRLDPLPELPTSPQLAVPGGILWALLPAVALIALAGAAYMQRRADAVNVAEAMRLAG